MKRLALIPLLAALATLVGGYVFDADTAARFHRLLLVMAVLAAATSAFVTSAKFSAGDRLLVCWLLVGAGYLLAAIRHGVRLYAYVDPEVVLPRTVNNTFLILQNLFIVIALLLFVLAWHATGLTSPVSKGAQIGTIVIGIAVAVLVGGYPLMKAMAAGADPVQFVSTLGDIVGLSLIVPLALPALAMRGGVLMHTWIYLATSEVAWLLYDLALAVQPKATPVIEAFRLAAVLFAFVATVAQRRALR